MPAILPLTTHKADSTSGSFHTTKPAFAPLPLFLLLAPLLLPDLSRQAQLVTLIYYSLTSCAYLVIWESHYRGEAVMERCHLAEAICLKAWHILLLPLDVTSLSGLLVWCCFPSCNQAQHPHFFETPLDTSLFKLIE